jgi:hypothetical protein
MLLCGKFIARVKLKTGGTSTKGYLFLFISCVLYLQIIGVVLYVTHFTLKLCCGRKQGVMGTVSDSFYSSNASMCVPYGEGTKDFTLINTATIGLLQSRGSSVSIVSVYGLDDRGSMPSRGRGFFL